MKNSRLNDHLWGSFQLRDATLPGRKNVVEPFQQGTRSSKIVIESADSKEDAIPPSYLAPLLGCLGALFPECEIQLVSQPAANSRCTSKGHTGTDEHTHR